MVGWWPRRPWQSGWPLLSCNNSRKFGVCHCSAAEAAVGTCKITREAIGNSAFVKIKMNTIEAVI